MKKCEKQHRCTDRTTVFLVFSSVHVLLLVDQGLANNVSKNRSTFFIFTISTLVLALALALVLVPVLVCVHPTTDGDGIRSLAKRQYSVRIEKE